MGCFVPLSSPFRRGRAKQLVSDPSRCGSRLRSRRADVRSSDDVIAYLKVRAAHGPDRD